MSRIAARVYGQHKVDGFIAKISVILMSALHAMIIPFSMHFNDFDDDCWCFNV